MRNYYAVASDPKQAASSPRAIDSAFANSSNETRTASIKEWLNRRCNQIGDLDFVIRSIVSAVLVALLFSVATMMMQTNPGKNPRVGRPEDSWLYRSGSVFPARWRGDSGVRCGAAIGLALAMAVISLRGKFVPGLSMPMVVIGVGLVGAILVALISAAVPAFRASRLEIVDALAGR